MTLVVAQLGCGYWGPNILRNLTSQKNCIVKWVADPRAERRQFVADYFPGVRTTADWIHVLDDDEVEAVVIATPAHTHAELAKAALAAGKHILVEKPLASSVAEVDELAAAANGRIIMVGHTFVYNGAVRYLKTMLDQGSLGDIHYAFSERLNLGQVRSDVNVWWNLAPHDISIILYLFGGDMPETVAAHSLTHLQPDIEDVVFSQMLWKDKRAAHFHLSWLDPGKSRRMTIVGSRKMVVYDDMAEDKIRILDKGVDFVPRLGERMDFDQSEALIPVHRQGDVLLPRVAFPEPLKVEIDHFLDCVRTGKPPLTGIDHARSVVAVLEAGQKAIKTGRTIPLDL